MNDHLILTKKWAILSKKALNTICHTAPHKINYVINDYHITYTADRLSHLHPGQIQLRERETELKNGSGRKIIKCSSPKRLWDDGLKHESHIRSNIAHG